MKLIEKILIEASYEDDSKTIALAKKYINKTKEYLNAFNGSENNVVEYNGKEGYITVHVGNLNIILIDSRYNVNLNGGYKSNLIAVYNTEFSFDDENKKLNYKINESSFLHELVHYFDDKRSKTKGIINKTGHKQEQTNYSDDPDYVNNSFELNAHFLQKVFPIIESYILHTDYLPKTFDAFKDESIKYYPKLQDFYNALNAINQKKFVKRLYKIYDGLKKNANVFTDNVSDENLNNSEDYQEKQNKKINLLQKIKNFFIK